MERNYQDDIVEVSNRLRFIREDAGYSQEKMAEILDVSPSTVHRVEGGKSVPQLDLIFKLADAMDISITQILPKRYTKKDYDSELKVSSNYSQLSEANKRIVTDTVNRLIDNLLAAQLYIKNHH